MLAHPVLTVTTFDVTDDYIKEDVMWKLTIASAAALPWLVSLVFAGEPERFAVRAPDGRSLSSTELAGRPYLLWYEAPDTVELNDATKAELQRALDESARRVALVAVGDLSRFDYWPARGIAQRKLKEYARKYGHVIYGDWSGAMRDALALRKGESNLVYVDADGVVRFRAVGKVTAAETERVRALIRGAR
jgi:hypothetical protein